MKQLINSIKYQFLLPILVVSGLIAIPTQTAYAETPVPIQIVIEEKITVGDGNNAPQGSIDESITVNDEVNTGPDPINESITVTDEVNKGPDPINESTDRTTQIKESKKRVQ